MAEENERTPSAEGRRETEAGDAAPETNAVDLETGDDADALDEGEADDTWDESDEDEADDTWDDESDEDEWDDELDGDAALLTQDVPSDYRSGFVAVVGRPNVGKSTLVNAYVGRKVAIVSPKPQTTRRRILGVRTSDEAQVVFVDTPGIHRPLHKLGEYMVEAAMHSIPDADVVLFVVDVTEAPRDDDRDIAQLLAERAAGPVVLALNKSDAVRPDRLRENFDAYVALLPEAKWMLVSAERGDNLDKLLALVVENLPNGPQFFPAGQATDQNDQIMTAEIVREAVLHLTQAEVPHSVAVAIESWEERGPNLTYIEASVFVERDSQKGIIIGRRGSMLRDIGSRARQEIEELLGQRVYLELRVKVREKWRNREDQLRRLGYTPDWGDESDKG